MAGERRQARVFYEGSVQGVGFRYTALTVARGYDVCGWIKNLPDGRVELLAQGERGEVEDFLVGVRESGLAGHIKNEVVGWEPLGQPCRGFAITE